MPQKPFFRYIVSMQFLNFFILLLVTSSCAKIIINAVNLIVASSFIDSHTHVIRGIFDVPTAESLLLQGVTTLTDGNDGTSPYPINY
jgi:N-acyl-D-amino-acid deacylase